MDQECNRLLDHEDRIRKLEESDTGAKIMIDILLRRMDNLMGWIKALVFTMIPSIITLLGFLIYNWIKN